MAAGLSGADPLAPGTGAVNFGVEANLDYGAAFAEVVAKPVPGFSLFGRGEAFVPWSTMEAEARVIFGGKYTW